MWSEECFRNTLGGTAMCSGLHVLPIYSTSFGSTLKVKCPQLCLGPQANTEEISVTPEEIMRGALGKPSSMTEKVLEKWWKAFQRRTFLKY